MKNLVKKIKFKNAIIKNNIKCNKKNTMMWMKYNKMPILHQRYYTDFQEVVKKNPFHSHLSFSL
jgi:hypothetical protein